MTILDILASFDNFGRALLFKKTGNFEILVKFLVYTFEIWNTWPEKKQISFFLHNVMQILNKSLHKFILGHPTWHTDLDPCNPDQQLKTAG